MGAAKSSSKEQWKVVCILKSFYFSSTWFLFLRVDFEISVVGKALKGFVKRGVVMVPRFLGEKRHFKKQYNRTKIK